MIYLQGLCQRLSVCVQELSYTGLVYKYLIDWYGYMAGISECMCDVETGFSNAVSGSKDSTIHVKNSFTAENKFKLDAGM